MPRLTTDIQTKNLEKFTTFKAVMDLPWKTVWEGKIRPHDVEYKVSITLHYRHKMVFKDLEIALPTPNPEVIIEDPKLEFDFSKALATHFYFNESCPERSPLCLYHYSEGARWMPSNTLADTVVPWTIQHMAAYEVWEDTGMWMLPEKHPTFSEHRPESDVAPSQKAEDTYQQLNNSGFLYSVSEEAIIRGAKL